MPSPVAAEKSDPDLVQAVAEGDKLALRAVWDRYLVSVRAVLRAQLGADPEVDDIVQEVFISLYRSAGRIREPSLLRLYLMGTAAKLASGRIRSRARRGRWYGLLGWANTSSGASSSDVFARDALRSLRELLAKIPAREREAFVLRYVHDLSPEEVALALEIPKGTAKHAIADGRRRVLRLAQNNPALAPYLRPGQERPR